MSHPPRSTTPRLPATLVATLLFALAAPCLAQRGRPAEQVVQVDARAPLATVLARVAASSSGPLWFRWEVDPLPSLEPMCCFDGDFRHTTCHLEGHDRGWGSRDDAPRQPVGALVVLARWGRGEIERVRVVTTGCAVDAGAARLVDVAGVTPEQSVALLADLAGRGPGRRAIDEPLVALAYHGGAAAEEALRRLAGEDQPQPLREQALFWIGQARGEEGVTYLADVARRDPSPAIREKAVFALSQSDVPRADEVIVEVARQDGDPKVRGEALFWLAQSDAPQAPAVLLAALDGDPSPQVRKKAVFAISQLDGGQAVPLLVRIARERREPEVRREALFWLGQSDDPRALDFLADVLEQ